MRIARDRGYGQNPVGTIKIAIIPLPSQLGRVGKLILHQPSQWKTTRRSLTSSPTQYGKIWKLSILHPRIMFMCRLRHQRDQEGVAQEEQDVIDRYYFSRYGRNGLNLIRYGERSYFLDPKPRASLEEVPSPKSTVSLYLLSIKFDKKLSKTK